MLLERVPAASTVVVPDTSAPENTRRLVGPLSERQRIVRRKIGVPRPRPEICFVLDAGALTAQR